MGQRLDIGRDVQGMHGHDRPYALRIAPGQELGHGASIGAARVGVVDIGGEEF